MVEHLYFYQPAELDVYKRNKSNIIWVFDDFVLENFNGEIKLGCKFL